MVYLRPLQPLPLAERQCVTITISDETAGVEAALDQAHFLLSPERWEAFCALLDRPPRQVPALQKLLTQPSVLDVSNPPFRKRGVAAGS